LAQEAVPASVPFLDWRAASYLNLARKEKIMHGKLAWVVGWSLLLSTCAIAQKNEVALSVGALFTESQQINLVGVACPLGDLNCAGPFNTKATTAVALQGSYTRRLYTFGPASLGVEFPVLGIPSRDANTTLLGVSAGTSSLSSLFFTPSLRFKFLSSGPMSPFVSFGAGLARFDAAGAVNRGSLQFGGGVDFKTPVPRLAVRGEIRDF
jgi:hypothetical protein